MFVFLLNTYVFLQSERLTQNSITNFCSKSQSYDIRLNSFTMGLLFGVIVLYPDLLTSFFTAYCHYTLVHLRTQLPNLFKIAKSE